MTRYFRFTALLVPLLCFAASTLAQESAFSRDMFENYIRIFNAGDSDLYARYYHPDVVMERGDLKLEGIEAILAFYQDFHDQDKQTIDVQAFLADEDRMFVELQTLFEVHTDWSHPFAGEMKKGRRQVNSFVHYQLQDGKIILIQSARLRVRAL